jgi:hypothetical protein
MEGLLQPVHVIVAAGFIGLSWLLVRVIRNAWKG